MSKQDGTQPSTKQRRSSKTNTTNLENGKQDRVTQRPALMILRDGKHIGSSKDNPGELSQRLTLKGNNISQRDVPSPRTLSKVSILYER